MNNEATCPFCVIVASKDVLWSNADFIAILDRRPQKRTHVLVLTKRHVPSFEALRMHQFAELCAKIPGAVLALTQRLKLTDYRILINNGKQSGQRVLHLHAHVLSEQTIVGVK